MQKQGAPQRPVSASSFSEEGTAIRILYHVLRHAMGKSGPVRIQGVELTRTGDTVTVRPVNSRGQPVQSFFEVPWRPAVLRQLARVLEDLAAWAEQEEAVLRSRMAAAQGLPGDHVPEGRT